MSYAPEVTADYTGKWYGNAVRFATKSEAEAWAQDRAMRWTSVRDTRVVESPRILSTMRGSTIASLPPGMRANDPQRDDGGFHGAHWLAGKPRDRYR